MSTPYIYRVWSDSAECWITRPLASRSAAIDTADCLAASYPNNQFTVAQMDITTDAPEKFIYSAKEVVAA